jgi:hypothetical protein
MKILNFFEILKFYENFEITNFNFRILKKKILILKFYEI